METLLAILLYLQIIFSPGTYEKTYIDNLEIEHQTEIQNVQNNPEQMRIVNEVYLPQVEHVIIINLPTETGNIAIPAKADKLII